MTTNEINAAVADGAADMLSSYLSSHLIGRTLTRLVPFGELLIMQFDGGVNVALRATDDGFLDAFVGWVVTGVFAKPTEFGWSFQFVFSKDGDETAFVISPTSRRPDDLYDLSVRSTFVLLDIGGDDSPYTWRVTFNHALKAASDAARREHDKGKTGAA